MSFSGHFNSQLFNVKSELLDFSLISSSVLFQCQVVLLLLSCSQCPLFQLFLVPIHFKLELVHFFISFENHILDIVESILLISHSLL